MNILIIGSGGREHALGKKLCANDRKIFFAPGNAGTSEIGENIEISASDIDIYNSLAKWIFWTYYCVFYIIIFCKI